MNEPRYLNFEPHPLFRGGHLQTVAGAYLGRTPSYRAARHHVRLPDGDQVVLHDDHPPGWRPGHRVVLLVHGLAGCHGSGYMARVAGKLASRAVRVFRMDQRGCGAGVTLARQTLHAGRWPDLNAAAAYIAETCPDAGLTLVGFSLGASVTLKLLGGAHAEVSPNVDSAIAVAPPLDLQACSRNIGRGWNRIYDRAFVKRLVPMVQRQQPDFDPARGAAVRPRSLYEFDAAYTAPLGGYADVADYYQRASALRDLVNIRVPTTILAAEDDPLVPYEVFRSARLAATTRLMVTRSGGHLGYLARPRARNGDPDWHWMDWRIVDWVDERRASKT